MKMIMVVYISRHRNPQNKKDDYIASLNNSTTRPAEEMPSQIYGSIRSTVTLFCPYARPPMRVQSAQIPVSTPTTSKSTNCVAIQTPKVLTYLGTSCYNTPLPSTFHKPSPQIAPSYISDLHNPVQSKSLAAQAHARGIQICSLYLSRLAEHLLHLSVMISPWTAR
jgi:hypothetical protein